jgi:hypothetical protein
VEYQVDPTPLTHRRSRRILAVTATVAIGIAVLVGGLAIAGRGPSGIVPAAPIAAASSAEVFASAVPVATPSDTSTPTIAPGPPPRLACHGVPGARCADILRAVLIAVADPTIPHPTTVDIWASLLCGSTFDCPPGRMEGQRPAGSAVVVACSIWLWVNVTDTLGASGPNTLSAWVIRSGPVG